MHFWGIVYLGLGLGLGLVLGVGLGLVFSVQLGLGLGLGLGLVPCLDLKTLLKGTHDHGEINEECKPDFLLSPLMVLLLSSEWRGTVLSQFLLQILLRIVF